MKLNLRGKFRIDRAIYLTSIVMYIGYIWLDYHLQTNELHQLAIPEARIPEVKVMPLIRIQPFRGMSQNEVEYVFKEIKKFYSKTTLLPPIEMPKQAYYKPRSRYRADSIIAWLSRQTPEYSVVIGLTSKDISTTKDKIIDWGVMGLGYQPGNACVTSTFRLNKANLLDQLFKVSVHELGHTQGLPHCPNKNCYMQDAEGGNPTDSETGFCAECTKKLEEKGWDFSSK